MLRRRFRKIPNRGLVLGCDYRPDANDPNEKECVHSNLLIMRISYEHISCPSTVLKIRPLLTKLILPLDSFLVGSLFWRSDPKRCPVVHHSHVLEVSICLSTINLGVSFRQFMECKT